MTVTLLGPLTATGIGVVSVTANGANQPQAGDRLIIFHGNDFYALSNMGTPTASGGAGTVTAITGATADAGSNLAHCKGWYADIASTGDVTVTAVETGAADEDKIIVVYVARGADLGTAPVGNSNEDHSFTNVTVRIANGVTPSGTDDMLIVHTNDGGGSSSAPYTPPAGMAETYDTSSGGSMGAAGATEQLASGAATGTRTWTVANTITAYGALTVAVKAAASAITAQGRTPPQRHPGRGPSAAQFYRDRRSTETTAAQASSGSSAASAHPSSSAAGTKNATGATASSSRVSTVATGIKNATGTARPSTHPVSQAAGTKAVQGTAASSARPASQATTAVIPGGPALSSARVSTVATGKRGATGGALASAHPATQIAGTKKATGAALVSARPSTVDAGRKAATGLARVIQRSSVVAVGASVIDTASSWSCRIEQGRPAWDIGQGEPIWRVEQGDPAWRISQG